MFGSSTSSIAKKAPNNSGTRTTRGNLGHRPGLRAATSPWRRLIQRQDIRGEMLTTLGDVGIEPVLHHHEVAPAQHELGFEFSTLTFTADNVQKYKYVVHNVAHTYGKTVTFMPKPVYGDNGSGMHVHQSIWKDGKPLFAGSGYADLSRNVPLLHRWHHQARQGAERDHQRSTNSYKRLIPGLKRRCCSPTRRATARPRSAFRIGAGPKAKRIEVRFPDPTANPYLAFSAMLMAGLDGIENKIHPGEAMDKNLYDLPPEELKDVPRLRFAARSLAALDADRAFLKKGDVFSDDQIDSLHRPQDGRDRALGNDDPLR
jgi:glutamine synthetase